MSSVNPAQVGDNDLLALPNAEQCVLMFSGGRDSTLAAISLFEAGIKPVLVTVTSEHLFGYEAVEARLKELKHILPLETLHLHVTQPRDLRVSQDFYFRTCLPCQHAYAVVAVAIAKLRGIEKIALGYSKYQNDWPEQTEIATSALSSVVAEFNIQLLLPVYCQGSKDEVKERLAEYKLSSEALEQKCSRQINNIALSASHLREQVAGWENAIRKSIQNLDDIALEVRSTRYLGSY